MAIQVYNPATGQPKPQWLEDWRANKVAGAGQPDAKDRWRQVNQLGGFTAPTGPLAGLSPSQLNAIPDSQFNSMLSQMQGQLGVPLSSPASQPAATGAGSQVPPTNGMGSNGYQVGVSPPAGNNPFAGMSASDIDALKQFKAAGMSEQDVRNLYQQTHGQTYYPGGSPTFDETGGGQQFIGGSNTNPATPGFGSGTGVKGSEAAMMGGYNQATQALADALSGATDAVTSGYSDAQAKLNPYLEQGGQASQLQAALSGALGADAQQEAYTNFQNSPGQQWLIDQTERAITRNAAATGGTKGGNVLRELQSNASGLAQQDFQNSFNRLGDVAKRGFAATGASAGMDADRGNAVGDLTYRTGLTGADMAYGLGNALGGQRYDAGIRLSGNIGTTTNNLANLQQRQGADLAGLIGTDTGNLARILAGIGESGNANANQLAVLLANLSQNQGSAVAGLPGVVGDNSLANLMQALGGVASAYNQSQGNS